MLRFGSLFAGIGGFDLGFERAGMICKWQVEIDPYCQKVLAKHWPSVRRHDDIKTFPPTKPEEWQVDVICGGDPCQGNSNAGSVYKSDTDDLGTEFLRVIDAIRPRIVIRENPSITRPGAKWSGYAMQSGLRTIGYKSCAAVRLRACCFGLGHKRERLFLLAALSDTDRKRLERIDWQGVKARDVRGICCNENRKRQANDLPIPRGLRAGNGLSSRVDATRALGNTIPPQMSEFVGRMVVDALGD